MRYVCKTACILLMVGITGYASVGWTTLPDVPVNVGEGGALAYGWFPGGLSSGPHGDTIYCKPGYQREFYRFDISLNAWRKIASHPQSEATADSGGGAMAFAPVHGFRRMAVLDQASIHRFIHYGWTHTSANDSLEGQWFTEQDTFNTRWGCAITYGGTGSSGGTPAAFFYMFRGGLVNDDFYRLTFLTPERGEEETRSALQPVDGFSTYVTRGALTWCPHDSTSHEILGIGRPTGTVFKGYCRSQDEWVQTLSSPWDSFGPGISLAANTIGGSGDSIFALRGNNTNNFSRYDVKANAWSSRNNAPFNVGAGAGLAYSPQDGRFYATRGGGNRHFARYQPYSSNDSDTDEYDDGQLSAEDISAPVHEVISRASGHGTYQLSCPAAFGVETVFAVYDATGRRLTNVRTRDGNIQWTPENSGVYLVVISGAGINATGRLTVVR